MKAFSVRQPFADYIQNGDKTIELRSKPTKYRGELVVCSSKSGIKTWLEDEQGVFYACPTGVTVAKVNLIDCRPATKEDAEQAFCEPDDIEQGMWAWVFDEVVDLKPNKVNGKLNFFNVDDDLIEQCGETPYFHFFDTGTPSPKDFVLPI